MLRYLKQVSSKFRIFPSRSQPTTFRSNMEEVIKLPQSLRGKTILEKHDFDVEVEIPFITVNKNKVSSILPHIKKYCLKLLKLKFVQNIDEKVDIYLNPRLVRDFSSFSPEIQSVLRNENISEESIKLKKIMLGYDNFSLESIFKAVLPPDKDGM